MLIGDNPEKTNHPKIQKTNDPFIPFDQLEYELKELKIFLEKNDVIAVKKLLNKLVKLYKSNSSLVDHIYVEQSSSNELKKKITFIKSDDDKIIKIKS